ncbi:biotin/lipoyl-binding carrier protein [Mumia zhuanghuii]|uniref:Biotin/lipoyl-binding carrier protein n=1 Tax=Mumia zhuanghuii TaxID=2585211 RepID=A0A5C4MI00_9ACTN|nr:biotin/lipoyl-binding carrier protein [Mumia zhuanghuii]TNC40977.1 biotin/lipoyl-binding carrier protein [Mumia zhuanghuii]TNC49279.1 biotin/lipoyl-binding carrier protein [Mumia zhuanghuii]
MHAARAEIVGNVWRLVAKEGDLVDTGDVVAVLETMKMEIPVHAGGPGTVRLRVREGEIVQEGDVIAEIG